MSGCGALFKYSIQLKNIKTNNCESLKILMRL
ncbi:protein of unknown function [Paraburkholderia kururiensis]